MVNDIKDIDGLIKLVTLVAQADEAVENEDWAKAIELFKEALENYPPELEKRRPGARAEMLKTIGSFYLLLEKPREAKKYFAESYTSMVNSADFKELEGYVEPFFDVPVRDLPFEVEGLPYVDEPYQGLVVPDALPLLQHIVHIVRPYGLNIHTWMYEAATSIEGKIEESAHELLPGYLTPSDIDRLSKPRKYNPDEAVIMRGKDGNTYKLESPGRLSKVSGGSGGKKRSRKRK
ncbi:MAG: tetratricopeptide repeat protein [Candidatus Competibacteraceae bacterium]|nr:tetratricopeptide repeat protein [Candidatus Competibacteraceae bacterium]